MLIWVVLENIFIFLSKVSVGHVGVQLNFLESLCNIMLYLKPPAREKKGSLFTGVYKRQRLVRQSCKERSEWRQPSQFYWFFQFTNLWAPRFKIGPLHQGYMSRPIELCSNYAQSWLANCTSFHHLFSSFFYRFLGDQNSYLILFVTHNE